MPTLVFSTKKEAIEFLRNLGNLEELTNGNFCPKGTYYLAHGEYSQHEFKPARYKDGWGIKKIHFFYSTTLHVPKDGRCIAANEWGDGTTLVLQDSFY